MIIFASIASSFPTYVIKTVYAVSVGNLNILLAILILLIFIGLTACVVFLEKGSRKIPVQYSRRIIGQRVYGGQSTYIPMKLNPASIMPVILATSLLQMPMLLARFLSDRFEFFKFLSSLLDFTSLPYNLLQFGLIVFFTFAYAALTFNPVELADQMKKNGGFVPGIRPGKKTADFFDYVLMRIGLVGSLYLGVLAVFPNVLNRFIAMPFYFSGTQLLIVVGVALEFASQVESYLIEHKYEGFLTSGRLKQ
jgi:preprotein translocase subunit SecY